MTKAEFVARYGDTMIGLLLSSFAFREITKAGEDVDMAVRGRFIQAQMKRATKLLEEIWDAWQGTIEEDTEALLERFKTVPGAQQEAVKAKLRETFKAKDTK